jgi:transglutaminase-like putative cysteine protease
MSFKTYFKASSYTMIAVAMLALALAGGLHPALGFGFLVVMITAWKLEGTKWQLSERAGLLIVLLSIPLFFLDWQYQRLVGEAPARVGVNALAHLIVFLSAIKLLQVKSDRDWVFLYLISFFEVLLAAGLSFSPVFFLTFTLYLLCALSTVIAFEIQKARRRVKVAETRLLVPPDSKLFRRLADNRAKRNLEAARLPFVAVSLLFLIFILALPLFLVAPRAGSATISRAGAGLTNFIGFSENVTLGEVGSLKRNNEVVMRVRVEGAGSEKRNFKWRGVALDEFTGRGWRKSAEARRSKQEFPERGFFRLGTTSAPQLLTTQTVFLEPISSAVLFAAPRALAIQGDFQFIRVDAEGSIQSRSHDTDRLMYKVVSDTSEPNPETLRQDIQPYSSAVDRYRTLPRFLDPRIEAYANAIVVNAHTRNRYDRVKAIETALRSDYGYTLEMKAAGPTPLSDFLFNVREGHCEYFSTAMAVMVRTLGIPVRVVNGFLPGEYNQAAGAYTVRQSDAHSWVEVYFPETDSWITFDPTPAAGRLEPQRTGVTATIGKYAEALELMWYQYVVGYDQQEQRSLATSFSNKLFNFRRAFSRMIDSLEGKAPSISPPIVFIGLGVLVIMFTVIGRRILRLGWRRGLSLRRRTQGPEKTAVEFYQRLTELLAKKGMTRPEYQTPLEFASDLGLSEAMILTRRYNQVRFGGKRLSPAELREVNQVLETLEAVK